MDMKTGSSRAILGATVVWLAGVTVPAGGQAVPAPKPLMRKMSSRMFRCSRGFPQTIHGDDERVLGGSGDSCETCHDGKDGWASYALDTVPRKRTARRMVQMMAAINQTNFADGRW